MRTSKIIIMNICDVNSFLKILQFYPTLKNGWSKHDFFVTLNAPVGVHEKVENLLTRIGIRDLTFCDEFFLILLFLVFKIFENKRVLNNVPYILYYILILRTPKAHVILSV